MSKEMIGREGHEYCPFCKSTNVFLVNIDGECLKCKKKWIIKEVIEQVKENPIIEKIKNKSHMRIHWRCKLCGSVQISDSYEHHKMDTCKCGKSSLDLEQAYSRMLGAIETIKVLYIISEEELEVL